MTWKSAQRLQESGYDDAAEGNAFKIGYAHGWGEIEGESTAQRRYPTPYWAGYRVGCADRYEHYAQKESNACL